MRLVSEKEVTASKEHQCDAYDYFVENDGWDLVKDDPHSYKVATDMRDNRGKILNREVYLMQTVECDGEISTVRMNKEMHAVNCFLGIYTY